MEQPTKQSPQPAAAQATEHASSEQSEQEARLSAILVEALDLEDVEAKDISPLMPLFGVESKECLGLDSIDALEIALAIEQHFGVKLKAEDENNKENFASLRTLSNYIDANL